MTAEAQRERCLYPSAVLDPRYLKTRILSGTAKRSRRTSGRAFLPLPAHPN
jgi:hypothetical protein